jgi:hypothetical protein
LLVDHPALKVELVVGDRLGGMIEDRLDLAMRFGEITDTSLVARRSGTAVRVAAAAPSYIKRHGEFLLPVRSPECRCRLFSASLNVLEGSHLLEQRPILERTSAAMRRGRYFCVLHPSEAGCPGSTSYFFRSLLSKLFPDCFK